MRKITVLSMITLDGVIQAPGGLTESHVTSKGIIIASYKRAGEVITGNVEI